MDLPALREARMKTMFRNLSLGETQKQKQENSAVRKDSVRNQPIQKESVPRKQPVQGGSVPENVYIVIMGLTGVGKSTFISRLVGSKVAIGHDLESCTQEIGVYSFQYNKTTKVHLIDTPGFDDTNRTDFHVLEEIASFLSRSYKNDLRINGIIYLHRISDNRMQGSSMTSIRMFRKLVGTDFYPRVVLATTMWESVKHDDGIKREAELISDSKFWGYMKERGCKIRRAMNTKESAMDIVGIIVAQQSSFSNSEVLAVQRELVDQGKDLIDTNVGREVENQFSETLKRQQDELAAAKEELRLARQTQGLKARSLLIEQRRMISEELKRMTQIQENMRQEMQKELERREKRHQAEIQKLMQMNEKIRADIANAEKRKGAERITPRIAPTSSMPSGLPADEYDLDSIIERLLEVRGSPPGKQVQLLEGEIQYLIEKARGIFLSQPILLELKAPLKIVGDIRGQYYDLLRVFEYQGFPPEANYLFLGNYVDHGQQSLETICLCLAWKIKYPENFFMLRGFHECASLNRVDGFYDECKRRYRDDLWKRFTDVFYTLPLAAIIEEKIMYMSGDLSPDLNSMDQIKRIMRPTDIPDCGRLADLFWSDPDLGIHGWSENDRGSYPFGPDVMKRFCNIHTFDLVARGIWCVLDSFEFFARGKLVRLWAGGNSYRGRVVLDEDLLISFAVRQSSLLAIKCARRLHLLPIRETEGQPQRPDDDEHPDAERDRYFDEYVYGWRKGLRDSEQEST